MDPRRHQHQLCFSPSFLTTLISYHTFSRNARGFRNFFKKFFKKTFWKGTQAAPGLFCEMSALFILFILFVNFKFFLRRAYPFGALRGPRGGPYFSAPAESRQRQAQGSFTPLRIPGPKWGAGRPLWKPPCPRVSRRGTSACHARRRMGQRSKRLCGQRLRKSARKLQPRSGEEFRCPLARLCRRHSSAPKKTLKLWVKGESQRGRSPLWPVFAYFLLARK